MARQTQGRAELSPAEWEVMSAFWRHGPMAARDVYARLRGRQDWTYGTVRTFLARMVKKGWLDYDQVGNSYLYKPAVPRRKAVRGAIVDFVDRVLEGTLSPFVAYLAEHGDLSPEELDDLDEMLKRHREKKGRGKP